MNQPQKENLIPDRSKRSGRANSGVHIVVKWRQFKMGLPNEIIPENPSWRKRCPVCKIGVPDFYVRKANELWSK